MRTRMHSSRMCTVRNSSRLRGVYLVPGVYLVLGGYLVPGGYLVLGGVPGPGRGCTWYGGCTWSREGVVYLVQEGNKNAFQ